MSKKTMNYGAAYLVCTTSGSRWNTRAKKLLSDIEARGDDPRFGEVQALAFIDGLVAMASLCALAASDAKGDDVVERLAYIENRIDSLADGTFYDEEE